MTRIGRIFENSSLYPHGTSWRYTSHAANALPLKNAKNPNAKRMSRLMVRSANKRLSNIETDKALTRSAASAIKSDENTATMNDATIVSGRTENNRVGVGVVLNIGNFIADIHYTTYLMDVRFLDASYTHRLSNASHDEVAAVVRLCQFAARHAAFFAMTAAQWMPSQYR
jgi:hypothetical protein